MPISPIDRLSAVATDKEHALWRHVDTMNVADDQAWQRELELTRESMGANFSLLQEFRLQHFLTRNLLTAI